MKALLLVLIVLLLHHIGAAQSVPATVDTTLFYLLRTPPAPSSQPTPQSRGLDTHHIDQMPVLQGGIVALRCLLYQNNQLSQSQSGYPTGIVFVGFIIDTTGRVQDARILQGLHPALDAEALRLANLLNGHFTPARNNNRPLAVSFTLPVHFPALAPAGRKQRKRCASSFTANTR